MDDKPNLYLRITPLPTYLVVDEGTSVSSMCEVTGSGSQEINITWIYNGVWDVLNDPLDGVEVNITSTQQDLVILIVAQLIFKSVHLSHAGLYTCRASITCPPVQVNSSITLNATHTTSPPIETEMIGTMGSDITDGTTTIITPTITPTNIFLKPFHAPLNLVALIHPIHRNIHLHWTYPLQEEDSNGVTGFKIDWNTAAHITSSARTSFPTKAGLDSYRYIITTETFNTAMEVLVRVWAYNIHGDGPYSTVRIDSVYGKMIDRNCVLVPYNVNNTFHRLL